MQEDFKGTDRRGGGPPKLIPGLSVADPKTRILVLVALFAMLLTVAGVLKGYANRPEAQELQSEAPPSKQIPEDERFSGIPTLDRRYVDEIKDGTPAEQGQWDEKAIAYLLAEARSTPAVLAYRRRLLPVTAKSGAEARKDPKPWRLQFVRFRGKLEYMQEGDYADISRGGDDSIGRVHVGRILIDGAEADPPVRVKFVTPTLPLVPDEPDGDDLGWMRGRGIFVKNYLDVGPDGEEVPAMLVIATRIGRDYETRPVTGLKNIPFTDIQDDPSLLVDADTKRTFMKWYPKPLFRLLAWATPRTGAAGAELRKKEGLKPAAFEAKAEWEALFAHPEKHRGDYVGGLGAMAIDPLFKAEIEDDKVNDAGVESYMTGWLVTDSEHLVQFVAPAALHTGLKRRARIRFEGFFYKIQGYYARDGTQRMAPFLVLTVLEEVEVTPPDTRLELFIAAGFVLGIAVLVFIIVREDKTKQDYRRTRRRQKAIT
jgi:hypothetical protein